MAAKTLPSADDLRALFDYNPDDGTLHWKVARSRRIKVGMKAGCRNPHGYLVVGITHEGFDHLLYVHRIAYCMVTGDWPRLQIDHINGFRSDNRWSNLREATGGENRANMRKPRHNTSGLKGASFSTATESWMAQIQVKGRNHHLGLYSTKEAAHAAYCEAAQQHFGEFACFD